jgi:hypothetical protein
VAPGAAPGSAAHGSGTQGRVAPGFAGGHRDDLPPEPDEMPDEVPPDEMPAGGGTELIGMELIQRELGGQVIREIEE